TSPVEVSRKPITPGAEITVIPELPWCAFNPPYVRLIWLESWHRADFRVSPLSSANLFAERGISGKLSSYVGLILVAEVKVSVEVLETPDAAPSSQVNIQTSAKPYQSIF